MTIGLAYIVYSRVRNEGDFSIPSPTESELSMPTDHETITPKAGPNPNGIPKKIVGYRNCRFEFGIVGGARMVCYTAEGEVKKPLFFQKSIFNSEKNRWVEKLFISIRILGSDRSANHGRSCELCFIHICITYLNHFQANQNICFAMYL